MGKNSITNSLRSILRKFEVVEIVDLVTIAQKLLLIWRKKKKKKRRRREKGRKNRRLFRENLSRVIHLGGDEFRRGEEEGRGHRLDRMSMSGVVNFIGHRASPIRAFSHRWTRAPWSETFSPRCYIKARGRGGHHETDPRYLGECCTLR